MPPIVPTGAPDSSRGNSATVTMSREDLMAKTATQLKALLKERGLPAGDAAKSTLVDRFLKGKKKAPKSNAERRQHQGQPVRGKEGGGHGSKHSKSSSRAPVRGKERRTRLETSSSRRHRGPTGPRHRRRRTGPATQWAWLR